MEKIAWDEKYSVGVRELDDQHRIIFDLINRLVEVPDLSVHSADTTKALSKMTEYFWVHLDTEEKYMREYGYPDYERHKRQHSAFKRKVMALNLDTMDHKDSVPTELLNFLLKWWRGHILNEDMRYRSFFREQGLR